MLLNVDREHNSCLSDSFSSVAKAFNVISEIGLLSMQSNSALAKATASRSAWNVCGFFPIILLFMQLFSPLTINCPLYTSVRLCPRAIFSAIAK